jgi:Zn-dependent M28 family amino/carboxypeptidase
MEAAAAYIERQLSELGDTVARQTYRVGGIETCNLVVERRGLRLPEQIVVVGAHYDTVCSTPGADDNASAVAMLIEVARLLAPSRTRRTLRFASFSCEEPPHFYSGEMGSRQYAGACHAKAENIVGMLCLEMVGYYSNAPGSQGVPPGIPRLLRWVFPRRGDFLASVGNFRSLKLLWEFRRGFKRANRSMRLFSIALPERIHEIRLSDNSSFWDQGYPALMITDTSYLRNPNYHLSTDAPDKLDYGRMAMATMGVVGAVARIAKAEDYHILCI